jgi:transposase
MMKMARPQPQFTDKEQCEIEKAYKQEKQKRAYIKLLVLKLKAIDRLTSQEIAKQTGYHKNSVNKMVSKYKKNGLDSVIHPNYGGNHAYLDKKEEEEFLKAFEERAQNGQMLEVSEIAKAYEEKIGKKVSLVMIYLLLKRHNWRKVMPRSEHPKRADEYAIEAYKKNQ